MNHCDYGHQTIMEIRSLPLGEHSHALVCHEHYEKELEQRRKLPGRYTYPKWESLKVYSPAVDDPLDDPRFPNRPQHPDFWALSSAMTWLDGEAVEGGRGVGELVAPYVDENSVTYAAINRAIATMQRMNLPDNPRTHTGITAAWIDGFTVACKYLEERKEK